MAYFLRKVRKSKWYKNPDVDWLQEGELQADALVDLLTKNNKLSVWLVDGDQSNLERIAAALSITNDNLSNFDYKLIPTDIIGNLGIKVEDDLGETPDSEANHYHRNLIQLTATQVFELANLMHTQTDNKRIRDRKVEELLRHGLESQHFDISQITSEKMKQKLGIQD